jgi:threonine dehydratase
MPPVTVGEIRAARDRINGVVLETPLVPAWSLEVPDGNRLWLKAENLQRTHSFKIRGAYNAIASLSDEERARGVITYSSGNHGQAAACAAHLLGVTAIVVMPEDTIPLKVDATRTWGAIIEFAGRSSLDRQRRALELAEQRGYVVIPPFDDVRIIAGQGTAGLEVLEQLPELQVVVVQVGGGGLISGISTAVKALRPDVKVIGVEPEGAADAKDSLQTGHVETWKEINTVADGLRTSSVGNLNFSTIQECVDDIVTVSDDEILRTVGLLALDARLVVEPSGAVAVAAVLNDKIDVRNQNIVAMISGGNIDPVRLEECLRLVQPVVASS